MGKKKKSNSIGKVSSGNKKKINKQREEKRQLKFQKKREEGKEYNYAPNPYEKGTRKYFKERRKRAEKNTDHRLPISRWTSTMAKLENQINKEKILLKQSMKNRNK